MKIAVDARCLTDANLTGVGEYTKQLLQALFEIDRENEYILLATGRPETHARLPEFSAPNVRVKTVNLPNKLLKLRHLLTKKPLLDDLIGEPVDIFFAPTVKFIQLSGKTKLVLTVHDLSFEIFPQFFSRKMQLWHKLIGVDHLLKRADAILCPSESTKQDIARLHKIAAEKIHVTPLGIDPSIKPEAEMQKEYLLFFATLEPRKNVVSIIEAYEKLRDQTNFDLPLVLAGGRGWKSDQIFKAYNQSKHKDSIRLTGYVDSKDKNGLYTKAKVFLFPSYYEGFGLPPLEAMAAGVPVITSHTSSLPEAVGKAAIMVDPYNVNDLFEALKSVLSDKELQNDLIQSGLERSKLFSWRTTAKKTLQVFRAI